MTYIDNFSNFLTQAAADARYFALAGGFGGAPPIIDQLAGAAGVANTGSRSDHTHQQPLATPRGVAVTPVTLTTPQTALPAGPTDIASMSVTFTAVAGRRYKVTGFGEISSTVADDSWKLIIADGAGNQLAEGVVITRLSGVGVAVTPVYVVVPGAGSVTYKLRVGRITGTGTGSFGGFAASSPALLLVEDIGI